jgi:hypothetical protein
MKILVCFALLVLSLAPARIRAQSQVMGELRFSAPNKAEKDSGVWIDGQYVGYLRELKGDNKIMLLPGRHEISVRQAGYQNYTQELAIEPGQVQILNVAMQKDARAQYPTSNAAILKLNITPARAAVFVDDGYIGHASDFGGAFHSMQVIPGKHHVKIELPGYRTFETEISPLAGQTTEIKTDLVKGSIQQADELIKEQ